MMRTVTFESHPVASRKPALQAARDAWSERLQRIRDEHQSRAAHRPAARRQPAPPAPSKLAAPRPPALPPRSAAELDADIDNALYAHLFPKESHRG